VNRCGYCAQRFTASRRDARWCSPACRLAVHRAGGTSAALRERAASILSAALETSAALQRAAYLLDGGHLWDGSASR
jgi:hypothetical protein